MTITNATVTTTVELKDASGSAVKTITNPVNFSSLTHIIDYEVTIPTSVQTVVAKGATANGYTLTTIKFCYIENTDDTNFITVGLLTASDTVYFEIQAGESIYIMNEQIDTNTAAGVKGTMIDLATINIQSDTAACLCKVVAF